MGAVCISMFAGVTVPRYQRNQPLHRSVVWCSGGGGGGEIYKKIKKHQKKKQKN